MFGFVPNLLTLANLACGLLAIPFALQADTTHIAFQLIILSSVFDFFDGMAARALKVEGPLGMQLDSLADVVSFGVVPGLIWKSLILLIREKLQLKAKIPIDLATLRDFLFYLLFYLAISFPIVFYKYTLVFVLVQENY